MHPGVDNETVLMIFDGEERNEIKPVLEPPSCRHDDVLIEQALEKLELQSRVIENLMIEKEVLGKELKQISDNVLQRQMGFEKEIEDLKRIIQEKKEEDTTEVFKSKIEDYFVDKKEKFEDDMCTPIMEAVKELNDTITEKSAKLEEKVQEIDEKR